MMIINTNFSLLNGTSEAMKVKFQNMFKDPTKAQELWNNAINNSSDFFSKISINNFSEFDSQRNNFVQVEDHLITTDWRKGKIGAF